MRNICVFDLDGTLIAHDSFSRLVFSRIFVRPRLVFNVFARRIGLIPRSEFAEIAHRNLIKDVDPTNNPLLIKSIMENIIPERRKIFDKCKESGAYTILMSASPQEYVKEIGTKLGFDAAYGSHWLEGEYIHLHGAQKRIYLDKKYPADSWIRKFAIGDSPSDMYLMSCFEEFILVRNEK